MATTPHSAEVLNDSRDLWWHQDFLELMAKRLQLANVRKALDVGCGKGHWGRILLSVLDPEAQLCGVDRETEWVEESRAAAKTLGLVGRTEYRQGTAEEIPFADDSFDLVTCQTVLMHVADAEAALKEMRRVLKPGGLLLAAEPSNEAMVLVTGTTNYDLPPQELFDAVCFMRFISRGCRALGRGDQTIGDRLPLLFSKLGLSNMTVHQQDRCAHLVPPYEEAHMVAQIEELRKFTARPGWVWEVEETLELLAAGGAEPDKCQQYLDGMLKFERAKLAAIEEGTYSGTHGTLFYLVSGRKPA